MRKLIFCFLALASTFTLAAQSKLTTRVEVQRNEKWWGVYVGGNVLQPFAKPFSADALECDGRHFTTPMMVSNAGRYIWSAYPMAVSYDGQAITVTSEFEKVNIQKNGRTLREAYLACYHKNMRFDDAGINTELFTRPVYKLQIETGTITDQQTVLAYADRISSRGWPTGTILIPDGWQSLSRGMEFNAELYPDPAAMITELHDKGFKVMTTITPYVKATGRNYMEAGKRGELLLNNSGSILVFNTDAGYQACLDMSRAEIAETLTTQVRALKERYDIDGFVFESTDVLGEIAADKNKLLSFTANWNSAGKGYDMAVYSPAVNTSASTYVNFMVNDTQLSWPAMATSVNDAINAGLCGYIYSNFSPANSVASDTDDMLMLSAIQLSLFMPIAVVPPTTDFISSEKCRGTVDAALKQRESMSGYIEEMISKSNKTAEPLVRHMAYQFPGQGFANCYDQFMLGTKYLVAPPVSDAATRTVRLPRGMWTAQDGTKFRGPRVVNINVKNGQIIYFTLQGK